MKFQNKNFTEFLDVLLIDSEYAGFVGELRKKPQERYYEEEKWHSVQQLLKPYPDAACALNEYAFKRRDKSMSFSSGNLKACYIIDEDFVNDGRAFVLFNLVATNWFYVGAVSKQGGFWELMKT
jgi:hypothetical protein